MMQYREALGNVIRETRIDKNLTLRQVSQRGIVALGYLSEVERGHKEASSEILNCIAYGLSVPVHELVIAAGYHLAFQNGHISADTFLELVSN